MFSTKTLRFNVNIDKKNSENYEISLFDLMKKNTLQQNSEEPSDEHDKLLSMIKAIEVKYGPVAVVKGKRIRINDFVDQGNGYDADDPFIDDSEGDEALVVAPDLMTEHGGFFINKESLKLSEGNFVIERVEGGNDLMNSQKQTFPHKNINKKSQSQKLLSQARKRLTISSKSNSSIRRIDTITNGRLEEIINNVVATTNIPENDKIDCLPKTVKKLETIDGSVPNITQEKDNHHVAQVNNVSAIVQTKLLELPTGLPDGAKEKIRLLSEISEICKTEGKKIEPNFDSILFELDSLLHNNNQKGMKALRGHALRYVGQITNIKYDAILRRLSKFKENKRQQKMKPLFNALEEAIKDAMVDSIARYEQAMKQYSLKAEAQRLSSLSMLSDECPNSSTDQFEQDSKVKAASKIKSPKRYFKWTLTCKTLLYQLVSGQLEEFRLSNNKTSPEEYLQKFYQTSVINLFPQKWMTVSQLMKISLSLVTEFKQCISNGKEFQSVKPKQKIEQKPNSSNNNQNGVTSLPIKEPIISLSKCTVTNDLSDCKNKTVPSQAKKPINQSKAPLNVHISAEPAKPLAIVPSINKVQKTSLPVVQSKSKPTVRSSSIMSPNRQYNNNPVTLAVKPQEPVKRYVDGSMVLSPNSLLPNHVPDNHGFTLIGLPPLNNHSDSSLSYLQNYLYSHDNHIDPLSRNSVPNTSSVNNLLPNCSQQSLHQQQYQHQYHQQNNQHHLPGKDFVHSTPYNIPPENISRLSSRQQKVPELSTIYPRPMDIRQSSHNAQPLTMNNQITTTNHNNVQQQQLHKQYMGILSDYDSHSQTTYHTHTISNNTTMIDLTGDSPTTGVGIHHHNQQLSPSRFVNMNTAHCSQNPRNFQN